MSALGHESRNEGASEARQSYFEAARSVRNVKLALNFRPAAGMPVGQIKRVVDRSLPDALLDLERHQ